MSSSTHSELALRAMTLRGVGSYLHGARLEIRPLTILCGKNGSGKSTWFKVLNMLSRSCRKDLLPFEFDVSDWEADDIQHTNAFMHILTPEQYERITSANDDAAYGLPYTVGLEFEAVETIAFPSTSRSDVDPNSVPQAFLWLGQCAKGTRFRIRLTQPTYWADDDTPSPDLCEMVELQLDEHHTIRLSSPTDVAEWRLECSSSFLPEHSESDTELITIADQLRKEELNSSLEEEADADLSRAVGKHAVWRIRELLDRLFDAYFFISAIRDPHKYKALDEQPDRPDFDVQGSVAGRYVGSKGEAAWLCEREFAYNLMRQDRGRDGPYGPPPAQIRT